MLTDPEEIKFNALVRLGIARQQKLEDADLHVYLDELEHEDARDVERACRQLARAERGEYETGFPSLGTLLKQCQRAYAQRITAEQDARLRQQQKQLPAHDGKWPEVTDAQVREFMAKFRADVDKAIARNRADKSEKQAS